MHVDWQKIFGKKTGIAAPPRYSDVFVSSLLEASAGGEDQRSILLAATQEERQTLVLDLVRESVAKVLRTAPARLEASRPLREMGLDSLMAFELLNRLQMKIGASLPNSKMSANSSIESLTALVLDTLEGGPAAPIVNESASPAPTPNRIAPHKQLIVYRALGSLPPIFFIHPAGGRTNIYDALASNISRQLPVYAIQSRLLSGAADEWTSIDELARDYAGIIMQQQPEGAIRIAGFSAGGIFALAAARELERCARQVSLLFMIETPVAMLDPACTRVSVLTSLITEVYDHLSEGLPRFHRLQPPDLSASILKLAQRMVRTKSETANLQHVLDWLSTQGLLSASGADSETRRFFAAFVRHSILIEQAKIQPVHAQVILCRARQSSLSTSPVDPTLSARITRGGFQQEVLEGRHFELMHPPLVNALARSLEAALAGSLGN
jgi:thioesterase domain-containing protein/acyl carrier protein